MKLVVGLGNPGKEYEFTRHNAGFMVADFLARDLKFTLNKNFHSLIAEKKIKDEKILLVKPQRFMNLSGESVAYIKEYYKLDPQNDILIVHDEIDLPIGQWRLSKNASSAGHKGVQSIIDSLSTQDFSRMRIGIESRDDKKNPPTEDFVLQKFTLEEKKNFDLDMEKISAEIFLFLKK